MRTELFFGKEVPEARKAEVRAAFGQRGLAIAREGPAALKSLEILDVRIDAAFIVGAAIGGALWEAEKELLRRGIEACAPSGEPAGR